MAHRPAPRNSLLAALPPDEWERLRPHIDVFPMKLRHMLQQPGEPATHVYFPAAGFISIITPLADGTMVEVATVGREGFASVDAMYPHNLGGQSGAMVQGEADCYRLSADNFRRELATHGALAALASDYSRVLMAICMQSTACNAVHQVEQRLARWLLTAHDRMESKSFALTQEFAATMLGTSRPTVSLIAGVLQRAGLIEYHRGQLTILDPAGLEESSCECYRQTVNLISSLSHTR